MLSISCLILLNLPFLVIMIANMWEVDFAHGWLSRLPIEMQGVDHSSHYSYWMICH